MAKVTREIWPDGPRWNDGFGIYFNSIGKAELSHAEKTDRGDMTEARNAEILSAHRAAAPARKGTKEDDEKLVQEGMKMRLKIEEAIEIHAKLEDAISTDVMGTRVFMAQLKGVLVDLRKDMIGGDA